MHRNREAKRTAVVAILLIASLGFEAAPARASGSYEPGGPSVSTILGGLGHALSPLASAGRAVGSWFNATFLTAAQTAPPEQTPVVPGEVPWKRSIASRTIRNANGSYTVESFTHPINYLDSGVWQPIDNTLVASSKLAYAWQNKANGFTAHFKEDLEQDAVALELGGATYSLTPQSMASVKGSKSGAVASYPAVAASTDLAFEATETGVRKTITLRGPNSPTEFTFKLKTPGATKLVPRGDGSLVLQNSEGKSVFVVGAPWARENLPEGIVAPINAERHAQLSAIEVTGGHEITLSVDSDWLSTPGRSFPVTVDPPINVVLLTDAYWGYSAGDPCFGGGCVGVNDWWLYAATSDTDKVRSAIKFDIAAAIPWNSIVSSANLRLWRYGCIVNSNGGESCSTHSENIDVHRITQAWSYASDTWDDMDGKYSTTVEETLFRAASGDWTNLNNDFDVTDLVQAWVSTTASNHGLLLKHRNEALGQGGPAYAAADHPSLAAPTLTVTYTANATHGYPPAAPGAAATQVDLGNATSSDVQYPSVATAPGRSLFRASDGTLMSIDNEGCHRMMRAAKPPYSSWSSPTELACDDLLQGFMRTDDSGTLYTLGKDLVQGIQFKRWSRSGNSTNWNNNRTTSVESTVNLPVGPLSIVRTSAGRIWAAYMKNLVGDTTPTLVLKFSDDDGANFGGQVNLVRAHAAQLVEVGSSAGIVLVRFSDGRLTWRSSSAWGSETTFAETLSAGDPFQAVADDQGRVHLIYASGGGIRYRMRDAAGTWTPAPSSNGTVIAASDTQPTLSTDGASLTMMSNDSSGNIVRRTWNGSWSSSAITVPPPWQFGYTNIRGGLPARLSTSGVLPFLWQDKDSPCPCLHFSHFDYLDQGAPGGSMSYPDEGQVLVGTITATATPVDEVGVQRVDFFVDRGGGLLGYLGSDSTPADGFTYSWNTKEVDGASKRLWPPGAYRVYAVAWDYKGNRGETNRPLSYVQDQDLGVRPYRPSLPVAIGAGLQAQVNLWNGNLTLTHSLVSDPTVIGPLSITRNYNSQDTKNGTAGRGWNAGADLDADLSFTHLIDHSIDSEYPQNVAELVETDGTPHFYQYTSGTSYAPFIDDFSVLNKNADGTWTLTMADGGRYLFNSSGGPVDYRTAEHTLDQPSFNYVYTSGRLTSVTDPVGRGATFSYDANNRLGTVSSNQASPSRTWTFSYNTTTGVLNDVQDPVNGANTTHFNYDPTTNLLTQVTTPAGARIQFGYDASTPRRITEVRQLHTEGATTYTYVTSIAYVNSSTTTVTRPKGNVSPCSVTPSCKAKYTTTYGMDSRYRVTSVQITLPDGSTRTRTLAWNNLNLQTSASDFSGNATTGLFDQAGNLLSETTPDPDATGPLAASTVLHRYDESYLGLQGSYFNNTTLTPPSVLRRLDPQLSSIWSGSPGSGVNADNFSVRWTGYVDVPTLGAYTFYTTVDQGSRLYVDGRELIDNWTSPVQTERSSAPVTLGVGLHPVTIEMFDSTGSAAMTLAWQGPGISKQTIPSTRLKPGFDLETSTVDEVGNVTTSIYDDPFLGRLAEQRRTNTPVGGSAQTLRTTFTYNTYGQRLTKTMPKGNTGGAPDPAYTTTYSYYGAAESAIDPCTGTSYPQLGLLKSISQPGRATKTHVQDGAGNIVALTEGKGTTCSTSDGLGRETSRKASDRTTATTFGYDRDGRQASVNDPTLPAPSTYTYDDLGRLATAKDSMAGVGEQAVTYVYDEHGNIKSKSDKNGTTLTTVDELDRFSKVTDPAQRIYSFSYDADGRLIQQDLPNATKAVLSYDKASRLTSYRNQTSSGSPLAEYAYSYEPRGKKLTEDGPQGLWSYRYDAIGRLEQAHDPTSGRTRRYVFDLDSNRTEIRLNRGWATTKAANGWVATPIPAPVPQTSWTGDDSSYNYTLPFSFPFFGGSYSTVHVSTNGFLTLGSPTGSTGKDVDLAGASFLAIAPYARDLKVTPVQNPGDAISVQKPLDNSFVRFRWKAHTSDGSSVANFEVILNNNGTITFNYQTLPGGGTARVGVTPGNQIDFVAVPGFDRNLVPSNAQMVALTPASETSQASYSYNALDQLASGTSLSGISYNNDGEQTSITGPSPRGAWNFTYDGRGLMKTAVSGSNSTTWTLDGESRVTKQVKSSAEIRYRFAGPGDTPAWEENSSSVVTASFVSGPGGLLASYTAGTPTFYLLNGHGDIVQTRDLSGSLVETYSYDENGNPTSTQVPTRYGYTGKWQKKRDAETSLIRMGARMFDPLLGRFTSWDPIEGGSLNGYEYSADDPVNEYDLDGQAYSGHNIGRHQLRFCLRHPFRCAKAFALANRAKRIANSMGRKYHWNVGQINAFRHAYWMALVTIYGGAEFAWRLGIAHERDTIQRCGADVGADLWNNFIGIVIGSDRNNRNHIARTVHAWMNWGLLDTSGGTC